MCSNDKVIALEEVTTKQKNQLDHILISRQLRGRTFVTSFVNFISDHKTIVMRCCSADNSMREEIVQQLNLRSQRYMKKSCMDSEKEDKMIVERIKISEDNQSNVSQITEPMIVEKIEISEDNESNVSQITEPNYKSLHGEQWLTDDVINPYLELIERSTNNVFIFSSHFYVLLERNGNVGRGWNRNQNIFEKRYTLLHPSN